MVLLEELIEQVLFLQQARKLHVIVSTSEVEQELILMRQGWEHDEFMSLLREYKMTIAELKDSIRQRLIVQRYFHDHIFS